jgi:glycolate oxidase
MERTMNTPDSGYRTLDADTCARLVEIVGAANVVTEADARESYARDETHIADGVALPEAVVKPSTPEEVAAVVRLANERRFPVTPRGAGSGLSGGAMPVCGGVVLAMERMNRIIEIDADNMIAVVEPGVVTNEINERVSDLGLFFAGYPMSLQTCFIGGNVAENAGGGRAIKYGVTERYVMGLEFVTPTGEIVTFGGKRVKDVSGYNIRAFMVGSEGTLGIVTKIWLRLLPMPRYAVALLALFPDMVSAISVVPRIMSDSGVIPTAVEFMDRISVELSCRYLNEHLPWEQAGAMLLIEVDGPDEGALEQDYDAVGNICHDHGALEVFVADNHTTRERLWNIRRNMGEALFLYTRRHSIEDVVVPPAAIPAFIAAAEQAADRYGLRLVAHGHAGDGNVHSNIFLPPGGTEGEWEEKLPRIQDDLYRVAHDLGGTISGEHGIGCKRKDVLPRFMTGAELDYMRRIKRALDPNNILNPGKVVDV